ncbi:MAG: PKD domain-containing protein, partial [Candidatus Competibacteraceae bacterium]|nr:PKD domain-containing protein [Candidatus Competibacteraceae bacterium]
YTYAWSNGATSEDISGVSVGTYTVTVTDANGCKATSTITLTEPPALSITTGTTDDRLCEGEQTNISASANGGTGILVISWNQGLPDGSPHSVNPLTTTSYSATVTDENGCTVSSTVVIQVFPNPLASFTSSQVCYGSSTTFNSTSTVASGSIIDYQWDIAGTNAVGSTTTHLFPSAGNYTVTLTVTTDEGCVGTITQDAIVFAIPDPGFISSQLSGCVPLCVTFTDLSNVQGSTIANWEWTIDGQLLSGSQPPYCFNQTGVYDVALTVYSAQGCSATQTINNMIQVNPNPVAAFTISDTEILLSDAQFSPMNQSSGEIAWLWEFGDGNSSTEEIPWIQYADTGSFCITLTVTNQFGCTDQAVNCLYIYPDMYVYIPNAFTPNGDKTNDVFTIEGIGIKAVDLEIFDRWGNTIFHSPQLSVGWTGHHQATDEEVMQGVYVYKAIVTDFGDQTHEFMGRVTLLR